jgi:hypothetical protein
MENRTYYRSARAKIYKAQIKIVGPEDSPDSLEKATNEAIRQLEGLAGQGYSDVWIVDVKIDPVAGVSTIFYKNVEDAKLEVQK